MKTVTYLPPGETTRIDLDAAEGIIFGVSLEGRQGCSTLCLRGAARVAP
jgi:hypothetical protein